MLRSPSLEIFMAIRRPERIVGVRLEVRGMKESNGGGRNNKAESSYPWLVGQANI